MQANSPVGSTCRAGWGVCVCGAGFVWPQGAGRCAGRRAWPGPAARTVRCRPRLFGECGRPCRHALPAAGWNLRLAAGGAGRAAVAAVRAGAFRHRAGSDKAVPGRFAGCRCRASRRRRCSALPGRGRGGDRAVAQSLQPWPVGYAPLPAGSRSLRRDGTAVAPGSRAVSQCGRHEMGGAVHCLASIGGQCAGASRVRTGIDEASRRRAGALAAGVGP